MKTQLTNLTAGAVKSNHDSGNLVLQAFFSPTGTGTIVVQATIDGVVIRSLTVTISATLTTFPVDDFFQHQFYNFDCTGMSGDTYAVFTSQRL